LSPHKDYILRRLAAVGYCAQAIFEELQERGYTGSYQTVKRYVHPLRKEALQEASVRFETPPGRQAQVDWGQAWMVIGGQRIKVHLFVMTMGYSRRMFAVATRDERLAAFLCSHEAAFSHFAAFLMRSFTIISSRSFWSGISRARASSGTRSSGTSAGTTAFRRGPTGPTGLRPRARLSRVSSTSSVSFGESRSRTSIISTLVFWNGS